MASAHPSELDSSLAADSVASSPRSEHSHHDGLPARVRFMCSFGGKILPRPHDNQLRYVGGDTRIVAINRSTSFANLLVKLSKLSGINNLTVKYQLPNEDLDALISVTTDEDVENMMDEYDRLSLNGHNPRSARLRLFLFSQGSDDSSRASSISSILDGSSNREQWFLDALNGGGPPHSAPGGLERGRSEASSIVSDVPDYLFGLENSDENPSREPSRLKARHILHENVSVSDPGSPAPVVSSPFCSTSSGAIPDLPPVRTKPENLIPSPEIKEAIPTPNNGSFAESSETIVTQQSGYPGNPMLQYALSPNSLYPGQAMHHVPVYYMQAPGPVPPATVPVQQIQIRPPFPPQYAATGQVTQIPMGYHQPIPASGQVYGGPMRTASTDLVRSVPIPEGINPQQSVYYGVANAGMVMANYPGMVVPHGAEDIQGAGMEAMATRLPQ